MASIISVSRRYCHLRCIVLCGRFFFSPPACCGRVFLLTRTFLMISQVSHFCLTSGNLMVKQEEIAKLFDFVSKYRDAMYRVSSDAYYWIRCRHTTQCPVKNSESKTKRTTPETIR